MAELTGYQKLVFVGVSKALTNPEIAAEIGGGGSVPNEIRRIIRLLDLSNRMHLMLYGIDMLVEADSPEAAEAWQQITGDLTPEEQLLLAEVHHACATSFASDLGELLECLNERRLYLEQLPDSPRRTMILAVLRRINHNGITLLDALRGMARKLNLMAEDIPFVILRLARLYHLAAMFDLFCALQESKQAKRP